MLAQLYLGFVIFELSFGLRLFVHFELVVHFVRLFMSLKGSFCCLVNLQFCLFLLVHSDSLLLRLLLHPLLFFLLLDGFVSSASRGLLLLLFFSLGSSGSSGFFRRRQLFVRFGVIFGRLINLGSCLLEFVLLLLWGNLVLLGSSVSDGLILGIIVRLLSIRSFVFGCADLCQHPWVILPSVVRLNGEPSGYEFNITTQI